MTRSLTASASSRSCAGGAPRRALLLALAGPGLLAGCAAVGAAGPPPDGPALPPEAFTLAGSTVSVLNPAGTVRVQAGSGPDVQVVVTRVGVDAGRLRIERRRSAAGELLRIVAEGPNSRRLLYPGLVGGGDSVQFRSGRSGFQPGRGGFLGLFGGSPIKVLRRPVGKPAMDAHADVLVSLPAKRRLDLQLAAGRVLVSGTSAELHVTTLFGATELDSVGGRVQLRTHSGAVQVRSGAGELGVRGRSASIQLSGFAGGRLEATLGAGTIRGNDIAAGDVRLRTGAGGIELEGLNGRRVELRSGAGRLELRGGAADTLLARTGFGEVQLERLRTDVAEVAAGKGDVRVALLAAPVRLSVEAAGSSVTLELPVGAQATLSLQSDDGRITVEPEPTVVSRGKGRLTARVGAGAGAGDIRVTAEKNVSVRVGPATAAAR